jgi:hypothetical protein
MASLDRHNRNIGGHYQRRESQSWARSAPACHNNVVADFAQLVKLLPPDAGASPLRSTVPLVDFWRTPESRFAQLSAAIGVALVPPIDLRCDSRFL